MKSVAVLHTVPVTIPVIKELVQKYLPGYGVMNFLDDSILPMLAADPGRMDYVMEKLTTYCTFAQQQGAVAVISACSSIGEVTEKAKGKVDIPVMRIDEAMMNKAAALGKPLVLCATLATTLGPSSRLLERKAEGRASIETLLISEAPALMASEGKEAHDRCIARALLPYLDQGYTAVLCQASMAAAAAYLPEEYQQLLLTSPEMGMQFFAEQVMAL